jgi:phosphatidate cytidylyltransferase
LNGLPPGFRGNVARRSATALITLPLIGAALFFGPRSLGIGIVVLALLLGLHEFFALLAARQLKPMRRTGYVLAASMFLEIAYPGWYPTPLWPLAALLLLVVTLQPQRSLEDTVPAAAGTLLGAVYMGGLGGTMAALLVIAPQEQGAFRVLLLLAIIMASDTAAFFVGHAVGRHRLAPAVSPGKTLEGALGGVFGGVAGALAVRAYGLPAIPLTDAVGLGVLVSITGIVGDLDESLLKRWAGVKDSGTLFPGHGGMLDRLDSLLFGAPVLYYYFTYLS